MESNPTKCRNMSWYGRLTALTCANGIIIGIVLLLIRGPWLDEFWTMIHSDPSKSIGYLFNNRWIYDVHPPLFFFLARAWSYFIGDQITQMRLINLGALSIIIVYLIFVYWRIPVFRALILTFSLLFFSSSIFLSYIAEYRSYFFQYSFSGILFISLYLVSCGKIVPARLQAISFMMLIVSIIVLVNIHMFSAIFAICIVVTWFIVLVLQRKNRLAVELLGLLILALIPLAIFADYSYKFVNSAASQFWIQKWPFGIWLYEFLPNLFFDVGGNLVAIISAGIVSIIYVKEQINKVDGRVTVKEDRREDNNAGGISLRDKNVAACLIFAIGILIFYIAVFFMNLIKPIVVLRYFIASYAGLSFCIALLAQHFIANNIKAMLAIAINAIAIQYFNCNNLFQRQSMMRWDEASSIVANEVKSCKEAAVYTADLVNNGTIPEEREVLLYGYEYMAKQYKFDIHSNGVKREVDTALGVKCPNILWIEHRPAYLPRWIELETYDGKTNLINSLRQYGYLSAGASIANVSIKQTKDGIVLIIRGVMTPE